MGIPFPPDRRRAATVAVVLLIAFLTGHIMQTVLADRDPVVRMDEAPAAAPELRRRDVPRPLPVPPAATLVPIIHSPGSRVDAACDPQMTLSAVRDAAVAVAILAPCSAGRGVSLTDGTLRVDGRLDARGAYSVTIPALSLDVRVAAEVDGVPVAASLFIPDARITHHAVISWSGPQVLYMQAPDTLSEEKPYRLGDGSGGASAEIYSGSETTELVVVAEVTSANCGRTVSATAIQSRTSGLPTVRAFEMEMPGCRHVGQVTRLKNLFDHTRIAER